MKLINRRKKHIEEDLTIRSKYQVVRYSDFRDKEAKVKIVGTVATLEEAKKLWKEYSWKDVDTFSVKYEIVEV